ncbi:MAG: hypothetical protein ACRDSK_02535 [Actinophytocola sp.]|uniref:hypothetical protein n=1 Tax=Actinophytocola sp. TaxID=1872138 RepID=UPI003D6C6CFD
MFGIAATALLGGTLVVGLLGVESAVMWTGTTGCVCLAGWLLAVNADHRARRHADASPARPENRGDSD